MRSPRRPLEKARGDHQRPVAARRGGGVARLKDESRGDLVGFAGAQGSVSRSRSWLAAIAKSTSSSTKWASLSRSRPRTSRTQRIVRGRANLRLRRLGIWRDMRRGLGRRIDDRGAKLLGGRPAIVARPAVLEQVAA